MQYVALKSKWRWMFHLLLRTDGWVPVASIITCGNPGKLFIPVPPFSGHRQRRPTILVPWIILFLDFVIVLCNFSLSRKTKTRKHSNAFVERMISPLSQLASKYWEKVKSCIECKIRPHVQRAMKKDILSKSTSVDSMCKANTMPRPCFCNGKRNLQSCSTCWFCNGGCAMIFGIGTTSSPCYSFGWSSQTWCTATLIGMQLVAFARKPFGMTEFAIHLTCVRGGEINMDFLAVS